MQAACSLAIRRPGFWVRNIGRWRSNSGSGFYRCGHDSAIYLSHRPTRLWWFQCWLSYGCFNADSDMVASILTRIWRLQCWLVYGGFNSDSAIAASTLTWLWWLQCWLGYGGYRASPSGASSSVWLHEIWMHHLGFVHGLAITCTTLNSILKQQNLATGSVHLCPTVHFHLSSFYLAHSHEANPNI